MGKWKMVRLGDVGTFRTGGTPSRNSPEYFGGIYPWITTVALGSTYIDSSNANEFLTEDAIKHSATKIIPANSLLIGIRVGVGKTSINVEPMCTNQDIVSISGIDNCTISIEYLKKYLDTQKGYFDSQKRGATIQGIKTDLLKELIIPLPPLDVQQKIADVLDKASALIELRRAQLDKLDLLVKSQFIEMFGDPATNPNDWQIGTIRNIVREVRYGSSRPAVDGGKYPYLRMNNITYNGELDLTDVKQIDVPVEELPKCTVQRGDVLFNRTNSKELVGKTCLYNRDEMMVLAGFVIRVRMNEKALPEFLVQFLNLDYSKQTLLGMCKAAIGQANINAQELQNIAIYIPPIKLQRQFVEFKEQVDKSKFQIQQSLSQLELNYKSLMQKCFRGEVF
jgi:type I restriction enzyme S subunit